MNRLCDAIELFFENLNDPRLNEYREKVALVRKQACLYMAKEITQEKEHAQAMQQSQNFQQYEMMSNHQENFNMNIGGNQGSFSSNQAVSNQYEQQYNYASNGMHCESNDQTHQSNNHGFPSFLTNNNKNGLHEFE